MYLPDKQPTIREILVADAILVFVAFAWGAGTPTSADLVRAFSPMWGMAIRMTLAGIGLLVLFPGRLAKAKAIDWIGGSVIALFVVAIYALLAVGLIYSTSSKISFIVGTSVLFVPFFVWISKGKRPHAAIFAGAALATIGLGIIGFTPGMHFNIGDLLALMMSVLWAIQVIVVGHYARAADPTTLVVIQVPLAGIAFIILALIFEPLPDLSAFTPKLFFEVFFTAFVCTILCFILQTRAQRTSPASHVAIILSLESLFGYLVAIGMGQDPFRLQGAIGGACIIAGVLLSEIETVILQRKKNKSARYGRVAGKARGATH